MSQYLIFQLHGPMASWGGDAPGEVRHTHELPSRSALLGLLAAGVGIRRDDTERLNAFNRHYSLVVYAIQFFRFIWGEKVIRWHYLLRRYCSKATRVMPYVMHTNSIRIISIN